MKKFCRTFIFWVLSGAVAGSCGGGSAVRVAESLREGPPVFSREYLSSALRPGHPRLFIHDNEILLLKEQLRSDPLLEKWYRELRSEAVRILGEPPVERKLIGPRLLETSREVLRRVSVLAGLYLLDGDAASAERARAELLTVAGWSDWNPSHFLDTAEMSLAVALGYDWLHRFLSDEDRRIIRAALVEKGLKEGLRAYQKPEGWVLADTNWNQVCNGGLAVAALAVAEDEPTIAAGVLEYGLPSLSRAMAKFIPDGGDAEGEMYWRYGTRYNVFYLAAMKSALGSDFGLPKAQGFSETGKFRIHSVGPLGKTFNFSDADESSGVAPQLLWMARQFGVPAYAEYERARGGHATIFHLLWSLGRSEVDSQADQPLNALFKRTHAAFFRTSWRDVNAMFVGFKGGDNGARHAHLDLGSFVLDFLGKRWASDPGRGDYDLPGYFDIKEKRWTHFETRTEAHNTLLINDENQVLGAKAPIVKFSGLLAHSFAVADLSDAYRNQVVSAKRGVRLEEGRRLLVQDELEFKAPSDLKWILMTPSRIELRGPVAVLTQGSAKVRVEILSPKGVAFEAGPAHQALRSLRIHLRDRSGRLRLVVRFAQVGSSAPSTASLKSLADW